MAQIKETDKIEIGEKISYKSFSMKLHEGTITMLKLAQKQSGQSWNRFIYNLLKKNNMGLLENILNAPQRTAADYPSPGGKTYDDTGVALHCESCGREFKGQAWMVKSKKSITCPSCWGSQKRNEEFS